MSDARQSSADFKGDHLSVRMFGARGDSTTDDTAALNAAFAYGIANRAGLFVPPGLYRVTGDGLKIHGSLGLYGLAGMGMAAPAIVYEGTGTALEIRNPAGIGNMVYATHLRNLVVQPKAGVTADKGIAMYSLSGGIFENVGVFGGPTAHFASAWYFYQSGIIEIRRPLASYCPVGFWFDGSTQNWPNGPVLIDRGDLFQNLTAAFQVNYGTNLTFRDNWIESPGCCVLIDNTSSDAVVSTLEFARNRVMFNAMVNGATGLSDNLLKVVAASGKKILLDKLLLFGNDVLVPDAAAHPISIDFANANVDSCCQLTVTDNFLDGYTAALVDCHDSRVSITLRDNRNVAADGSTVLPDVEGTATLYSQNAQCFGRDNKGAPSNNTTAYFRDGVEATTVQIDEGADQGSFPLLLLANQSHQSVASIGKDGSVSSAGTLTLFQEGGPLRWSMGRFNTEVGADAGGDFGLLAYHDDGTFAGAPLTVLRQNRHVGVMQGSPLAALHVTQTDPTTPSLIADGASGQTADLLQLRNVSGTPQFKVDIAGNPTMGIVRTFNDGSKEISGTGSPEGVVTATKGSLFRRLDGGAGTILYVKESGTGNTGWVAYTSGVLSNTGTPGTYTKVTTDAEGRVTAGATADLSGSDVTGTLAAARMPALTGDVTSAAGSVATALTDTGTPGTYIKVTTDAQGRVTTGVASPLGVADGGTSQTSLTVHGVLVGNGLGAVQAAGPAAAGLVFKARGSGQDPDFEPLDGRDTVSASGSLTGQTLAQDINLLVGGAMAPAGLYRLTYYCLLTSSGTGTSIALSLSWNDGVYTRGAGLASGAPSTFTTLTGPPFVVRSDGTAHIGLSVVYTAITVNPTYSLYYSLERLG